MHLDKPARRYISPGSFIVILSVSLAVMLGSQYLPWSVLFGRTTYIVPPEMRGMECGQYKVIPVLKLRARNYATLEKEVNGCVAVELSDVPFELHFNHVVDVHCDQRDDGALSILLYCLGLSSPIDLVAEERKPKEERINLKEGNCRKSPWRIVGIGECAFKVKG